MSKQTVVGVHAQYNLMLRVLVAWGKSINNNKVVVNSHAMHFFFLTMKWILATGDFCLYWQEVDIFGYLGN